jgi:Flp pilus assembly protein TadG
MNIIRRPTRDGKILVLTGLLLTVLLGMAALAIDLGVIMSTRTQLQAASDAGSLAGGTELLAGLGSGAFRTPTEVKANAETQAINFVAKHPAGEAASTSITAARDVKLGTATMDSATGTWSFVWDASPYNAVGVTTRRSSVGTTPGDRQLPLIFGPVLGTNHADITVDSVAVILPASGIHIPPGSPITSGLTPFAFSLERWRKYLRAVDYFEDNGIPDHTVIDPLVDENGNHYLGPDGNPEPLFYEMVKQGNGYVPRQLFDDQFGLTPSDSTNVTAGGDGILEMNIYPLNSTSGNFGTIDVGDPNNSTSDLVRQIIYGLNEHDLSFFPDSTFDPQLNDQGIVINQIDTTGDTGISSGIESAIEQILGQPRAMTLYSTVVNPGNNATFTLVDIIGIRFMDIDLNGNPKTVIVQPANFSDPAAIPDFDEEIGSETTFFTPLILAH